MLTVTVNENLVFSIENKQSEILVNGRKTDFDLKQIDNKRIHIIKDNVSYEAEVISFNRGDKSGTLKVNSNVYEFSIKTPYDELLHQLGIDYLSASRITELKAPMPGLVLKILVNEGLQVKKGENLLILEAMKMENIIKSPGDLTIDKIKIKPGDKVEKNQVVITFSL